MISVTAKALDAGRIFKSKISDHLPQQYHVVDEEQGPGPCVIVYTWNVMGRCRADQPGGRDVGEKSSKLSNNGYRLNETVAQYESRLFEQVAPVVSSWLMSRQDGPPVLVCLQEIDAHPRTQGHFLEKVQDLCHGRLGYVSSTVGFEHASVSIWLQDNFQQVADPLAIGGDKGLLAIDLLNSHSKICLRLVNAHLPFCGLQDDAGYNDGFSEARSAITHCVSTSPLGLLVVAGDFNLDVRCLCETADGLAHACVTGSAIFEDKFLVLDGCIAANGLGEEGSVAGEVLENSRNPDLFHGFTRSTYITHSIHYNLQGKVHSLSDDDLFALGLYHFADQPIKLEELLSKQPIIGKTQIQREPEPELFYGKSREEFVNSCIHFNLQDQVDLLSDNDLFMLGCSQFAVQPMKLEVLLRATDKEKGPTEQAAGNLEVLFYGCTRQTFVDRFISYSLQNKVQDLSDDQLFRLGQRDFCDQAVELQQLCETMHEQHTEVWDELQNEQCEIGSDFNHEHALCEPSSNVSHNMFQGHTRSSFMKNCIHFSLHGKAASLKDDDLLVLGLCHFGVQALKVEVLLRRKVSQESEGICTQVTQYDGAELFDGPSRINFIQKYINPELHTYIDAFDDHNLFRLGRYEFVDQVNKFEEMTSVGDETAPKKDMVEGVASTRPTLFYGLGRGAFIEKSIRYTLKHRVDKLDDEVLFWLGRQQFSTQHDHLEELLRHIPVETPKPELKIETSSICETLPSTALFETDAQSGEKLFHGLECGAFVTKYIHYKLQGRVGRLSDDQLFALGKCHFSTQASTFEQTLAKTKTEQELDTTKSETNAEAMQRLMFQSNGKRQSSTIGNTAQQEDARVGSWSYSLAGKRNEYVISKSQDGILHFSEEMSDDRMTVQNTATLLQSVGGTWFVGQLMQTDTGNIIGMIRVRFEGQRSISNFKALEDETWEAEDVVARKEGLDVLEGLTRDDFVKTKVHHNLQSKVKLLDDEELTTLAACHFNEQHVKLKEILAQRPQISNAEASLQMLNGHGLPREEFIKKHIHTKLHGKVHNLTEEELFDLGQLQYAEQFRKFTELRPSQPGAKGASKGVASLTNAAATLRMIEMSRGAPFRPGARSKGGGRGESQDVVQRLPEISGWSAPPEAVQAKWGEEECWASPPVADQRTWDEATNTNRPAFNPFFAHIDDGDNAVSKKGSWIQQQCKQTTPSGNTGSNESLDGLGLWLEGIRLSHHACAVEAWCEEMGAATLREVAENIEDVVERLVEVGSLKPLEQRRLKQAATSLLNGSMAAQTKMATRRI